MSLLWADHGWKTWTIQVCIEDAYLETELAQRKGKVDRYSWFSNTSLARGYCDHISNFFKTTHTDWGLGFGLDCLWSDCDIDWIGPRKRFNQLRLNARLYLTEVLSQLDFDDDVKKLAALLCIDNLDWVDQFGVKDWDTPFIFDRGECYMNLINKFSIISLRRKCSFGKGWTPQTPRKSTHSCNRTGLEYKSACRRSDQRLAAPLEQCKCCLLRF